MTESDFGFRRILRLRVDGDVAEALVLAASAQSAAEEADDLFYRVKITLERAILELLSARPKNALTHLNPLLALIHSDRRAELEALELTWEMTRAHIVFVDCALDTHQYESIKLLDILETGETFVVEAGRPEWRDGLLALRAAVCMDLDRGDEAIALLREAIDISRVTGSGSPGFQYGSYARNLARNLNELKRHDEAEEVLRELLDDTETSRLDRMAAHVYLGRTLFDMDRDEEAATQAEAAWPIAQGMFEKQRVPVLGLMVDIYRSLGRADEAASAATAILRISRKLGMKSSLVGALFDNADIAMDNGELVSARAYLDEALPLARELDALTSKTSYQDQYAEREARFAGTS